jgi:hypothetical protein
MPCACHTNLGIAPVAVSDEALEKITDVSIPTISLILRRMGFGNTFLSGCGMGLLGERRLSLGSEGTVTGAEGRSSGAGER